MSGQNTEVYRGVTEADSTLPMKMTCGRCGHRTLIVFADFSAFERGEAAVAGSGNAYCPCTTPEWVNEFLTDRLIRWWEDRGWAGLNEALAARDIRLVAA